jgi:hypothetical protein
LRTIRVHWKPYKGLIKPTVNWGYIRRDSVVVISASEYAMPGRPVFQGETLDRFVGDAGISVENVSPFDGGVTFYVNIAWDDH